MAEGSESSPLLDNDSSTDVFLGRDVNVQQFESARTEIKSDADSGRVDTVGGEADIQETKNSADGHDGTKLAREAGGNKIKLGEASKKSRRKPAKRKFIATDPAGRAANVARAAAYDSRSAAAACRYMMKVTRYVLNICKARVNEAIAEAEKSEEFDEAVRYRALANKYDIAINLAATGTHQIEAAAESAENASMEAEIAANEMATASTETSEEVEEKLSTAHCATNTAKMAAIVVYKIEYVAIKAVKKCLQDIDPESLEIEPIRTPREERAISRNKQEMVLTCGFNTASFIFGILIFASILSHVNGEDNPTTFISLVTIGTILIVIPVVYLIYKICMYYENKRREARQKINRHIITRINNRLYELEEYFECNKISPVPSVSENDEQNEP